MTAMKSIGGPVAQEREAMLAAIRESVRSSASYTGRHALSERVMAAMARVPREEFVLPR